jgi:hypothetical protein
MRRHSTIADHSWQHQRVMPVELTVSYLLCVVCNNVAA